MLTQLPNRKLQSFLHSVYFLRKDNFLYILLKNTVSYVDWLVKMEENHSLQFQWDTEVLQSLSCPGGGGGRVLPYISYIGMVFEPVWSENGYRF